MAELNQKLHVMKNGITEKITCYTTAAEVQGQALTLRLGGLNCYAKYGDANDPDATQLNVRPPNGADCRVLKKAPIPYGSQSFLTPGTFSFTAPANTLRISARAGGGAGGQGNWDTEYGFDQSRGGNGGAGGSVYHRIVKVDKGSQYNVVIGKGGNVNHYLGAAGGNTSFANIITITGGLYGEHAFDAWFDGKNGVNGSPMESNPALPNHGSGGAGGYGNESAPTEGTGGAMLIEWGGDIK